MRAGSLDVHRAQAEMLFEDLLSLRCGHKRREQMAGIGTNGTLDNSGMVFRRDHRLYLIGKNHRRVGLLLDLVVMHGCRDQYLADEQSLRNLAAAA